MATTALARLHCCTIGSAALYAARQGMANRANDLFGSCSSARSFSTGAATPAAPTQFFDSVIWIVMQQALHPDQG